MVYQDNANGTKASVMKYDGSSWVQVGDVGFSAGSTESTFIAIDSSDTPYVVYQDNANADKATVMKYNGTSWEAVGSAGFSASTAGYTSIALDSSDTPYVVYMDSGNSSKATVMKFNGTSWEAVGGAGFSASTAGYTSISLDSSDTPYVVYKDSGNSNKATVMKFNGTSWEAVGSEGFSAEEVTYTSIAIDGNNIPYVVYKDGVNSYKATVMKFNGISWEAVGTAGFSASTVGYPSIVIDNSNTPYVVYMDSGNSYKATVMKFNGTSWEAVGSEGFSAGKSYYTSMAIDSSDTPYVVYKDGSNSKKATVMKLGTTETKLSGTPTNDDVGTYNISLSVSDGENNTTQEFTITVNAINDAPTARDFNISIEVGSNSHTFSSDEFNLSDIDAGDSVESIKITSLETAGSLTLGGVDVTLNQVISTTQLNTLVFTPATNASGKPYASFEYQAYDGEEYSSTYSIGVNVSTPPVITTTAITTIDEDSEYSYDFNASDADGDELTWSVTEGTTIPSWLRFKNGKNEVLTLAGTVGSFGSDDGIGTSALLNNPDGLVVDNSGNVYVADTNNNLIRKIDSSGKVTTIAGTGSAGSADGIGTSASFDSPIGITLDSSGNIYVADYGNHLIRKIDSSGNVTTLAGSGSSGSSNGNGTSASFYNPIGIAVDSDGNVYVGDTGNNQIRKIDSSGNVTTLAGSESSGSEDGQGTSASFYKPYGIAVDNSGNIYVADAKNYRIRKIDSSGNVTTLAGSGSQGLVDGNSTTASFDLPRGIAVDGSGNVYVGDTSNHLIRKIDSSGNVTTLAGNGIKGSADGNGTSASFNYPYGIAVDNSGNIYVADSANHLIRKIETNSGLVGTPTNADAGTYTISLTVSDGIYEKTQEFTITVNGVDDAPTSQNLNYVYIDESTTISKDDFTFSDEENGTFNAIKFTSEVTGGSYTLGGSAVEVNQSISSADIANLVFTPDSGTKVAYVNFRVSDGNSFSEDYNLSINIGTLVEVSLDEDLPYIYDLEDSVSWSVKSGSTMPSGFELRGGDGIIYTVAGTFNSKGNTGDGGAATDAKIGQVIDVDINSEGNIYFTDINYDVIRKIDTNGIISIIAGTGSAGNGGTEGNATQTALNDPYALVVADNGDIYIADRNNDVVKKVDAKTGLMSIFAGKLDSPGNSDTEQKATEGKLDTPLGLALRDNILYISSWNIDRIKTVDLATGMMNSLSYVKDNGSSSYYFNGPTGLDFDRDGNIYVIEAQSDKLTKINTQEATYSVSKLATIDRGIDLEVSEGGLIYVSSLDDDKVLMVDQNGTITTVAGTGSEGSTGGDNETLATSAKLDDPRGIAIDKEGYIYVGDYDNYSIRKFKAPDYKIAGYPVNEDVGTSTFDIISSGDEVIRFKFTVNNTNDYPIASDVTISFGNTSSFTLSDFNASDEDSDDSIESVIIKTLPNSGTLSLNGTEISAGEIISTSDLGNLVYTSDINGSAHGEFTFSVNDGEADSLFLYTATLNYIPSFDTNKTVDSLKVGESYEYEIGLSDKDEDVLTLSTNSELPSWLSLNSSVDVTTLAGSGSEGSEDGNSTSASFNYPNGIAVDNSGNIYVADYNNHLIRKIDSSGNIITLAGSGTQGSENGNGTSASFNNPTGIAVDNDGNVYVADKGSYLIRKIDSSGNVTTLAGSGGYGSTNGNGTSASFKYPSGVAVDNSGNVYVADTANHLIRKIDSSGNVTTIAGSGTQGSENGNGTSASFDRPNGVAVDISGNVYVADTDNHLIRKIDTSGNVTTIAGSGDYGSVDGNSTSASFNVPSGVAVDSSGNVYVADSNNHQIRKIDSNGNVTTIAGSGSFGSVNGNGTFASFNSPKGIAVDNSGNLYVADSTNNLIRKLTITPLLTGTPSDNDAGLYDINLSVNDGYVTTEQNYKISVIEEKSADVALDISITKDFTTSELLLDDTNISKINLSTLPSNGSLKLNGTSLNVDENILNSDFTNLSYTPNSTYIGFDKFIFKAYNSDGIYTKEITINLIVNDTPSFTSSSEDVQLKVNESYEYNITVDDSVNKGLDVATKSGETLPSWLELSEDYTVSTFAGSGEQGSTDANGTSASFHFSEGIAVDDSGNIYVADSGNNLIRKIDTNGNVTTLAGSGSQGSEDGQGTSASFFAPRGVAVDSSRNVYVADTYNNLIRKIDVSGNVTTIAGTGSSGSVNGNGTSASFSNPFGVAVDSIGNIYVTDGSNNLIRKIDSSGDVTTLAGSGSTGSVDGQGTSASFKSPRGITVDNNGNVYVADMYYSLIRKIDSDGNVTTIAGSEYGSEDGQGTSASFHYPNEIALDSRGNLYIADRYNNLIRKIDSSGNVTTIAGIGSAGSTNGNGTSASFNQPYGIAVDNSGNIYVADSGNYLIRKLIKSYSLTGTPSKNDAGIYDINLSVNDGYVSTSLNYKISVAEEKSLDVVLSPSTTKDFTTSELLLDDTNISKINLSTLPSNGSLKLNGTVLSVDENISSSDFGNLSYTPSSTYIGFDKFIFKAYNSDGIYTKEITINLIVNDTPSFTSSSEDIQLDVNESYDYNITVDDSVNKGLDVASKSGETLSSWLELSEDYTVSTFAGSGSKGSADGNGILASFKLPTRMVVDSNGNIYVVDSGNHLIRKIDSSGNVTTLAGSGTNGSQNGNGTSASFNAPVGMAVDSSGNLYIADSFNHQIRKIDTSGNVTTLAGSGSEGSADGKGTSASFNAPYGVAVDSSRNVYVADTYNNLIRKIDVSGNVTTLAGSGSIGSEDGNGISASFRSPRGIAVDSSGNVYVADSSNHLIRKIDSSGNVTTIAGSGDYGSADGQGTSASFHNPNEVTVDSNGNLYVADRYNHLIRKIDTSGNVTTIAGSGAQGSTNGNGTSASFYQPQGVAVDGSGNLYVADSDNHLIRKLTKFYFLSGTPSDSDVGVDTVSLEVNDGHDGIDYLEFNITVGDVSEDSNGSNSSEENSSSSESSSSQQSSSSSSSTESSSSSESSSSQQSSSSSSSTESSSSSESSSSQQSSSSSSSTESSSSSESSSSQQSSSSSSSNTQALGVTIDTVINTDEDNNKTISFNSTSEVNLSEKTAPSNGSIVINSSNIVYIPNNNYNGIDSFTVTFTSGEQTIDKTVNITINSIDDAPVLQDISDISLNEDFGDITIELNASDVENDTIKYSYGTNSDKVLISQNEAVLNISSISNENGVVNIEVNATANGKTDTKTFSIDIAAINDAPVVLNSLININIPEDNGIYSIKFIADDVEGDELNISVESNNTNILNIIPTWEGLLTQSDYKEIKLDLNLSTVQNANGKLLVTINLNDGEANTTKEFMVNVIPVNDAPVVQNISNRVKEKDFETFSVDINLSDVDKDELNISASTNSNLVILDPQWTNSLSSAIYENENIELNISSVANKFGTAQIDIIISDQDGLQDNTNFTVTVPAVVSFPTLDPLTTVELNEDFEDYNVTLKGINDDNQLDLNITVSVEDESLVDVVQNWNNPINYNEYNGNDFNMTFKSKADVYGSTVVTVIVDNGLTQTTKTFNLNISPVNDKPILEDISNMELDEDFATFTIDIDANDIEDDNLTYSVTSTNKDVVQLSIDTNQITISAVQNAYGTSTVTFGVSDGQYNVTKEFNLTVKEVDDAPVLEEFVNINIDEDSNLFRIDINASDEEGDLISYSVKSSNEDIVSVKIIDGQIVVTPQSNQYGTVTIEVNATANSQSSIQSFDIEIAPVNDIPSLDTIINDMTIDEDYGTIVLDINVSDIEGDELNITIESDNESIIVPLSNWNNPLTQGEYDGVELEFNLTTLANVNGEVNIGISVTDSEGGSVSDYFNILVNPVNDAPVLGTVTNKIIFMDTPELNVTLNAQDLDNDTLNYSASYSNQELIDTITFDSNIMIISILEGEKGQSDINVSVSDGEYNATKLFYLRVISSDETNVSIKEENGNISHEITVGGMVVKATSQLKGSKIELSEDGGVRTYYEDTDLKVEVNATALGKASHSLKINGKTTIAKSEVVGAKTVIKKDTNGEVEVETNVEVGESNITVQAKENGYAIHQIKGAGFDTIATSQIPGTETIVTDNEVTTTAGNKPNPCNDTYLKAIVETFMNGKTKTKFKYFNCSDDSLSNKELPTTDNEYVEDNNVTVYEDGNKTVIKTQTKVDTDLQF